MARMLCIGECMVELAQIDPGIYRRGFAGDTFNTAWYARRLLPQDWSVGYLSAVGSDAVSEEMRGFMQGEGIDTGALREVPDRTVGLYMISTKSGERSFSYWRSQSAAKLLAEDEYWLQKQIAGADVIHFSGITLAILPAEHRARLCAAISLARAGGALVSFDTNLRPRLWDGDADMKAGIMMGATAASHVLPSFDEDGALFGDANPEATITRYQALGPKTVVVKNGAEAVVAAEPGGAVQSVTPKAAEKMVDSTAAGDSFAAGLLAGLATGASLEAAITQASALAAQVIQAPGALVRGIFETE